jgi:hypothetical protein
MLENWQAGIAAPPPRAFFRRVNILRDADPTYRPLTDA